MDITKFCATTDPRGAQNGMARKVIVAWERYKTALRSKEVES